MARTTGKLLQLRSRLAALVLTTVGLGCFVVALALGDTSSPNTTQNEPEESEVVASTNAGGHDQARAILFGIGSGLVTAALALVISDGLVSGTARELSIETQQEISDRAVEVIVETMTRMNPGYIPTHEFSPNDTPPPEYLRMKAADLEESSYYDFRGLAGDHVHKLVLSTGANLKRLRMELADPKDPDAIKARIRFELNHNGVAVATEVERQRKRILRSLVGLWYVRGRFSQAEIAFSSAHRAGGVERFDKALYVSTFAGNWSGRRPFPATRRFEHGSFLYEHLDAELEEAFRGISVTIDDSTTEADFAEILEQCGWDSIDLDSELEQTRKELKD